MKKLEFLTSKKRYGRQLVLSIPEKNTMESASGVVLFKLFQDLGVPVGNLDENAIGGWFDTDCTNLRKMLEWMCFSLSRDNLLPAHEALEFEEINEHLTGDEYEEALDDLERSYPELFNLESNRILLDAMEDELQLEVKLEAELNELIGKNKSFQESLEDFLFEQRDEKASFQSDLKTQEELCEAEACLMDFKNQQIHESITQLAIKINQTDHNSSSNDYIFTMDLEESRRKLEEVAKLTNLALKSKLNNSENLDFSMNLGTISLMQNRILQSKESILLAKANEAFYCAILEVQFVTLVTEAERNQLQQQIDVKTEQIESLVKQLSTQFAQKAIEGPKYDYAMRELQVHEENLKKLQELEDLFKKILSNFFILLGSVHEEKHGMQSINNFLGVLTKYVALDLQGINDSLANFKSLRENATDYTVKENQLINNIKFTLQENHYDFPLEKLVYLSQQQNEHFKQLQAKITGNLNEKFTEIIQSTKQARGFLASSPTNRLQLVCPQMLESLRKTLQLIAEQQCAVNNAVIVSQKKKTSKFEQLRNELWTNFLVDPLKMLVLLKDLN